MVKCTSTGKGTSQCFHQNKIVGVERKRSGKGARFGHAHGGGGIIGITHPVSGPSSKRITVVWGGGDGGCGPMVKCARTGNDPSQGLW